MRNCSSRSLVNLRGEDSGISNAVPPAPYQITLPFLRASRRTNPPGIVRSRFSLSRSFFANLYSVLYISCCIPIRKTYLPLKTDWCKKGRENLCPVSPHSIFARSRHLFLFPKNSLSVGLIYGRRFMPVPTRSFLQRTCLRKKLYFIFHPNIDKTKIV